MAQRGRDPDGAWVLSPTGEAACAGKRGRDAPGTEARGGVLAAGRDAPGTEARGGVLAAGRDAPGTEAGGGVLAAGRDAPATAGQVCHRGLGPGVSEGSWIQCWTGRRMGSR